MLNINTLLTVFLYCLTGAPTLGCLFVWAYSVTMAFRLRSPYEADAELGTSRYKLVFTDAFNQQIISLYRALCVGYGLTLVLLIVRWLIGYNWEQSAVLEQHGVLCLAALGLCVFSFLTKTLFAAAISPSGEETQETAVVLRSVLVWMLVITALYIIAYWLITL